MVLCSHHIYVEGECILVCCAFRQIWVAEDFFPFSYHSFLGYYVGSIYYHIRLNRLPTSNNSKL